MDNAQNINSDESLLLAYAAGELEGQALLQLEARLEGDISLRQRAGELRKDYMQTLQAVAAMNDSYRIDARHSLARIDQLMAEWEAEQAKIPAPIPLHNWRPPRWSYAAAACIALLIGFCFWWANNSPTQDLAQIPSSEPTQEVATSGPSNPIPTSPATSAPAVAVDTSPVPLPLAFEGSSSEDSDQLANIEQDVIALSNEQLATRNGGSDSNQ